MYIIDAKSDKDYFIVLYEDGKQFIKISKRGNTLETVKKFIGIINIKEIILAEEVEKWELGLKF